MKKIDSSLCHSHKEKLWMKKFIFLFLACFTFALQAQVSTGGVGTSSHDKQVVGYITNWDAWKNSNAGVPGPGALTHINIDYSKYTILNYSFFGVARDGSLHSGDLRNKNIYQEGVSQEPGDIFFTDVYSSWDMHILFGELDYVQYISPEVKERAKQYGFEAEVGASTWTNTRWGLSGSLPMPLPTQGGAPGLLEMAKQNGVKVMASIGGWSMCKHFPEMAADPVKRARFIDDCKKLIATGFDGIDIDWEYPGPYAGMNFTGTDADFKNFEDLMDEIRNAIGPDKLITAAFSADPEKLKGYDWSRLSSSMDYFNMMTYDFAGGFSDKAGHNAPVYTYDGQDYTRFNWESTYNQLISMGVPSRKINMGAPFYGRGVITDGSADLGVKTLKRSETVSPDGPIQTSSDFVNWPKDVYDGTPNHFFIKQKMSQGWTRKWDDQAKVPYLVKDNYFLSYDDEESIGIKAQFINDKNLGGTIIWTVYGDLEISGSATKLGPKLVRYSNVKSPLVNKLNEVFANGGGGGNQNQLPTVSITSPSNNATFDQGANVTITATAADSDGSVTKVEFYNGSTKLGEDTSSPYEFAWNNVTEGSYSFTAKATDNEGATRTSTAISVTVKGSGGGGGGGDCNDNFKVVGYQPSWSGDVNKLKYDQLTHIMYSFILPTDGGGLTAVDNAGKLQSLVSLAHAKDVKVGIAVGGWQGVSPADAVWGRVLGNDSSRATFINNLINFMNQYDLDGIDIDWEYPREGNEPELYEIFMRELSAKLRPQGKFLTAAVVVAGWTADGVKSSVFEYVDFLNIMAYDGPSHSSMAEFKSGLDYWLGRGLPKEKAVIGVPFYSRGSEILSWRDLLARGANPNENSFQGMNYNGLPLLKEKTEIALDRSGGIMFWELSHDQDVRDDLSMLNTISSVIDDCGGGNGGNINPTVSLTSPSNGASYKVGDQVSITANASDADGSIASVEFYANGSVVSTDTSAPYSYTWNATEGDFTIYAKATDDKGATANSATVSITVTSDGGGGGGDCGDIPTWSADDVYTAGMQATLNNVIYEARWWTQNQDPSANSSDWGVWKKVGDCGNGGGGGGGNNASPTVSITSPASGDSFNVGSTITIEASANDSDGNVTKVGFYSGSTLLGEDTSAPYTYTWNATEAGNYNLSAKATDDKNATGTSATVSVTINTSGGGGGGGGDCSEPQYTENGGYVEGSLVQNEGKLYRCRNFPNSGWCNGAAWAYAPGTGTYWSDAWELQGDCGNGGGGGGNNAPTVSITSPNNGQTFDVGNSITITANASDSDGSVSKVEFYNNGSMIGEATSAPYSYTITNAQTGNYSLTAKATDNDGASTTSSAIAVSVGSVTPPPPGGDLPKRILVGYWHNFDNGSSTPKLSQVSDKWDVINISFAIPVPQGGANMAFTPDPAIYSSVQEFKDDVKLLQSRGKKVLISMGGATGAVEVTNGEESRIFAESMVSIINEYGFDGMDIDFEGQSISLAPGDTSISNPTSPKVVSLISAFRSILSNYDMSKFILSMAPETAYVQGALGQYGGIWGAYLPLIYALRTEMDYIHVQHYNTGSMLGLDGRAYSSGNADFHVAMAEVLLQGFTIQSTGQQFPALRADQVAIGLPASPRAAGSGYTAPAEVHKALDYIIKGQSFGGSYQLRQAGGYPDFRGLMTWSINWDVASGSGFSNPHRAYLDGLKSVDPESTLNINALVYPNPVTAGKKLNLEWTANSSVSNYTFKLFSANGVQVLEYVNDPTTNDLLKSFDVSELQTGIYFYSITLPDGKINGKVVKQ